jgi:putative hydrolase of the HAD superfamily
MIKNLVFDLGNVLLSFKPAEYLTKNNYPETIKALVLSDVFGSQEWAMLDKGEISTPDAIETISKNSSLKREEITHIFNKRTDLMFPLDQNVRLLPGLKKRGLKLYYLSNFPLDIFDEVRSGYYFFKHFEGGLISAEAKHAKPDQRIYELLMEKYSLIPEECLFIDDIEINVNSARAFGMKGLFTDGSPEIAKDIEKALKDFE